MTGDKYGSAYLSVTELQTLGSVPASGDLSVVYDTSAQKMKTIPATLGSIPGSVAAGATLTLTEATHAGKTILLDTAAGSTATLPAATGSGAVYTFIVSVLATSNSHVVKVANSSDAMQGYAVFADTDTSGAGYAFFAVAGTSDTITLNRSTTGSVTIGETIQVRDIAANRFHVAAFLSGTGTPLTPFSATV